VAADEGVQEQTREHLFLSKMLGLPRVIVALNKMDVFDYQEEKFAEVKKTIEELIKTVGYDISEIPIIPCSALESDNIVKKSEKTSWYNGPTILELIEDMPERKVPSHLPLRLPVQDIYEIDGQPVVVGRLSSGTVKPGDTLVSMPQDQEWQVERILIHDEEIKEAVPGDNILLFLKDLNKDEIKRSNILGDKNNKPTIAEKFQAQVMILNHPEPINADYPTQFEMLTQSLPCQISKLIAKIDTQSGAKLEDNPKEILQGESAIVEIRPEQPVYIEAQINNPELSGFRLTEKDHRIAMGICIKTDL